MKKKILFLAFAPIIKGNGVANKILSQREAFEKLGHEVSFCHFKNENSKTIVYVDNNVFFDLGGRYSYHLKIYAFFNKLIRYVKDHNFDSVYVRYEKNANYSFVKFLKTVGVNCKIIMEMPTYPYDSESVANSIIQKFRLKIEKFYRTKFCSSVDYIATFSDHSIIYGVKTFKISNAVDEKLTPLRGTKTQNDYDYSFIGVANLAFWHGYDRLLYGLKDYYNNGGDKRILIKIVGEGNPNEYSRLKKIVCDEHLEDSVVFYGNKSGKELDKLFEDSDFAIGCLGCHRKDITKVKSLKNIEYAMRGIPFIYSELNDDFDDKPYIIKAEADDSNIDINVILEYLEHLTLTPFEIRNDVTHLTWEQQMKIVCSYF